MDVQKNVQLRRSQVKQFKEYSGNYELIGQNVYDMVNTKIFYWKNTKYSSHMLHPFMYNLKIWNKLNNIIINGYKDYVDRDLIDHLSSKTKFDEIFGEYGESRKFWKYNIMDLTGYTTRYEAAIKDEYTEDENPVASVLTGYDGLFYPDAATEYLRLYDSANGNFNLPEQFFIGGEGKPIDDISNNPFLNALYSLYWQRNERTDGDGWDFYTKWYSHLNYSRTDYQKIALQLWYWRERIVELIGTEYPMTKYCVDVQGNSLILMETFSADEDESNPYLVDLQLG